MRTCCSSYSHHRAFSAGEMDMVSWLAEAARLGLDGVELLEDHFASTDRDYLVEMKKICADSCLDIAMVSSRGNDLSSPDGAKRAKEVQTLREWADVAVFLGAPRLRIYCGRGEELAAGGSQSYEITRSAVAEVVAIGAERGVIIALENHGGVTADQLLKFHADVASPFFQLTLDTGNFPPHNTVHADTYPSIRRCAPHAAIVHAKFFNVQADGGDAEFDWRNIHSILAEAGFGGYLSIEYEGKDDDETGVVRRIVPFLKGLI